MSITGNTNTIRGDVYTGQRAAPSGPEIRVAAGTSAAELQQMIDSAKAGTVLRLDAGEFRFDRTITIDRDDISLVGAGRDQTKITAALSEGELFEIKSAGLSSGGMKLAAGVQEGAKSVVLGAGHGFKPGDFLWIERPNTEEFFREIGDTEWHKDKPLRNSIARIESVDGNTVKLENGLGFDYDVKDATVRKLDMVENVELGGFSIKYQLGKADGGDLSNHAPKFDFTAAVHLEGTYQADIHDIAIHDTGSIAFNFLKTLDMNADNLYTDGSHNKGAGGNGYAFQLKEVFESTMTNLEDHNMRHSVIFASWYSEVNNTIDVKFTDRDVNFHGGRDHGNKVHVQTSERVPGHDVMSSTVTYNSEGAHYGGPTEAGANVVLFDRALGTVRVDDIRGSDRGAYLDGRGANDSLTGGAGADTLIGGEGNDRLEGMGGNDVAVFSGKGTVKAQANGWFEVSGPDGTDTLHNVEWLKFGSAAPVSVKSLLGIDSGSAGGPPAEPVPSAGSGGGSAKPVPPKPPVANEPPGGVDDGAGNPQEPEVRTGTNGADILKGTAGSDVIAGGKGGDKLYGGSAGDELRGEVGNDILHGGGGSDELTGGKGRDVFRYNAAAESKPGAADQITDFGKSDRIDLSAIDADAAKAGDQAFTFIGDDAFGKHAGQLRCDDGLLQGDVDGNGKADFEVSLLGVTTLADDQFTL